VWTGKEVIVWGGSSLDEETLSTKPNRGGAAYNPRKDSWRKIPPAPIPGGHGYSLSWTGEEVLVWGDPDRGRATKGNRGAAFDPTTNAWRRIPGGPLAGRSGHLAAWTGDELIIWGGGLTASKRERYDGEGAAFDPDTNKWRRLSEAPLPAGYDAMGGWTGTEVIVMVSPMGIEEDDYPKFAHIAAYDPTSDSWRKLERPPFVTNVSPPAPLLDGKLFLLSLNGPVDGGEVNGYDRSYDTGGIYDSSREKWLTHSDPPERPNHTWGQVALDDEVVIDGLAYDPRADSWRVLPEFPLEPREFPVVVWTGRELIVWGGAGLNHDPPAASGAAYTPPG
jgi:N-acetylneuraminic acid mutarotase